MRRRYYIVEGQEKCNRDVTGGAGAITVAPRRGNRRCRTDLVTMRSTHIIRRSRSAAAFIRDTMQHPGTAGRNLGTSDVLFYLRFARPFWRVGVLALIATAMVAALKTVIPLSIKIFIDNILLGQTQETLAPASSLPIPGPLLALTDTIFHSLTALVFALFMLGFLAGGMDVARSYFTARFREDYAFNLQTALFEHVLNFPLSYFKSQQTGYIMSRLSDDIQIMQYVVTQYVPQVISNSLYIVFAFIILFTLNAYLTLVVLAFIPLFLLVNGVFISRIRAASYRERERQAHVSRDLQEVLSGIDTVKSHAAEDREVKKVSSTLRKMIDTRIKNTMLSAFSEYFRIGIQSLMLVAVFWFGGTQVLGGGMTVGDFVAFMVYIATFATTLNTFFAFPVVLQPAFTSAGRLREIFGHTTEPGIGSDEGGMEIDAVRGEIAFRDVSFGYSEAHRVLRDVTFVARPGEVVAIVGRTGAGKTTLINLILRAFAPQEGTITLDGHDLGGLDPRWLRRQISIVSQDLFLFHTTIEDNIRYSRPDATFEDVVEAARKAQIHDDIMEFPEQYKTIVGERGAQLSVGQRQRIAIARAFLKDSPILILDEPTSALDMNTEQQIRRTLQTLVRNRTTVLISHRPSLLDLADRVLAIEQGLVREQRRGEVMEQTDTGKSIPAPGTPRPSTSP
jgi:ABC-type multidrug transport system fused ATPase/permease subunit